MKTVLITGTSSGIGKAASLHLARKGYRVYATMRNLDKADEILKISKEEKLNLEVLQLDVTEGESCEKSCYFSPRQRKKILTFL